MEIKGPRVRCANCGMIYDRPPAQEVLWIGVPVRAIGRETCPRCGSNAADIVEEPIRCQTTDNTST
jgi:DNA-directed RNA polymerase subunit RPC12/RpoP